jgi:hypothetical protein
METAEKQLEQEGDSPAKSEELVNTKITDQEIPGISYNSRISVS